MDKAIEENLLNLTYVSYDEIIKCSTKFPVSYHPSTNEPIAHFVLETELREDNLDADIKISKLIKCVNRLKVQRDAREDRMKKLESRLDEQISEIDNLKSEIIGLKVDNKNLNDTLTSLQEKKTEEEDAARKKAEEEAANNKPN